MVNYKKPHNIYSQTDITRLTYPIKTDSPFEEGEKKYKRCLLSYF
jgi:hypothetical protein